MLFPFGKHKGKEFQEVPENYLRWFVAATFSKTKKHRPLRTEIVKYLKRPKHARLGIMNMQRQKTLNDQSTDKVSDLFR